ncbi:hypothetical protein LINPERPRIM_LOCUS16586 [Linum perenne]
MRRVLVGI